MLTSIISLLMGLVFPAAPAWVSHAIATALPAVVDLVRELDHLRDRSGSDRRTFVVKEVGELLDSALDDVPEWAALDEEQRDRMIGGLVELALFIGRTGERAGGRADVRQALRKLRR